MDLRYALIDLSSRKVENYPINHDMFSMYLGGKILGAKLLLDLTKPGLDVFDPDSVIVINTGPMNGTGAPSSSRFNMTFKNVLTGGIASSNCGGTFGMMLKKAGYDGIIIRGKSESPLCIEILDGKITFSDASHLWGLDIEAIQENLPKRHGKLVIGPGGENLVKYACAASGERVLGRCGSGAALGAKNIKAITAYGTKTVDLYDKKKFDDYIRQWIKDLKEHPMTGMSLPRYGSAGIVNKANASGVLPTNNFRKGSFDHADSISGETLAEKHLVRNSGCISCPIRCERRVVVNEKEVKGPEFETVGLFGSNINNHDLEKINQINYYADIYGLDTISLGGTLAFAMELQERNMADFKIDFNDLDSLIDVIRKIAYREGIYSDLADGSKVLSDKYGGKDFAIHSKGLELASYEPRRSVGMGLGYATSNRGGCHLNGGYLVIMEAIGIVSMGSQKTSGKAEMTAFMQNLMEGVSAAGFCIFTTQSMMDKALFENGPNSKKAIMTGKVMSLSGPVMGLVNKFLPHSMPMNDPSILPHVDAVNHATGLELTVGQFIQIGERGYNLERLYNLREGLTFKDDALPKRLTHEAQVPGNDTTRVRLDKMLPTYYKTRGWDQFGRPSTKRLKKLGII